MSSSSEVKDDRTPLHRAASNGQIGLVRKLVTEGAEIDAQDELQWTPLIIASSAGHKEVVTYLVEKGASVNATTVNGQSPLHYSASKGHLEITRYLVEKGAEINARDRLKHTPFHRAVLSGREDVVKYFLSTGKIQINAQDSVGNTALHLACEEECEVLVNLLVKAGANTQLPNVDKQTPLDLCVSHAFRKAVSNLFKQNTSN